MPPPIRIGGITTERQNTQITQNNTTQKVAPFSSKTYTLKNNLATRRDRQSLI